MFTDKKNDDIFKRYLTCYEKIAADDIIDPFDKKKNERHKPLKDFCGDVTNCSILDVGSSQGSFLEMLDGRYKVCFDISLNYLKVALGRGMIAVAGDGEHLPFKDKSFDIIICSDILEHVLSPEKVMVHLKRILTPNGRLYIVVPWKEDLSFYEIYKDTYEFTHLRAFDDDSINKLLAGFKILRKRGIIPKELSSSWPYVIRKLFQIVPSIIRMKLSGPVHMMFELSTI